MNDILFNNQTENSSSSKLNKLISLRKKRVLKSLNELLGHFETYHIDLDELEKTLPDDFRTASFHSDLGPC